MADVGTRIVTSLSLALLVVLAVGLLTRAPAGVAYALILATSGSVVYYSLFAPRRADRKRREPAARPVPSQPSH